MAESAPRVMQLGVQYFAATRYAGYMATHLSPASVPPSAVRDRLSERGLAWARPQPPSA